ncbi:MAG: ribosome maturation factor RimM [Deltaproteobacteria bacterium]
MKIGLVARAQGLSGDVALKLYNPSSAMCRVGVSFHVAGPSVLGRWLKVRAASKRPNGWVVQFEGVEGRDMAEALVGATVSVERDSLPEAAQDEVYLADLIGWMATAPDGSPVGEIVGLRTDGKRDFLVVRVGGGEELAPVVDGLIERLDHEARRVVFALALELEGR